MARPSTLRMLAIGLCASGAVHAGLALSVHWLVAAAPAPRPSLVPIEVLAPVPPPPPLPPPRVPIPTFSTPAPAPPRKRPRPKPVAALDKPAPVEVPVQDAGPTSQPTSEPASEPALVAERDAGPPASAAVDPAVIDLRPFVPAGSRVMLVLRIDRLRGTPWVAPLDSVLAPLPDHARIAGGGLDFAATFETLVIATPEPRDLTQTFLAARTRGEAAAVATALQRGHERDPRVVAQPHPRWLILVRPEHVAGPRPAWLDALPKVEESTGAGLDGPVAIVSLADLPIAEIELPLVGRLPVPNRLNVAVTLDPDGIVLTGAAVFADAPHAAEFAAAVDRLAAAGPAQRFLLGRLHLDGAAKRLTTRQSDEFVTFSTSVTSADAAELFQMAAAALEDFMRRQPR